MNDLFVIAGDAREPAGRLQDAAALLSAMGGLRERFAEIGISGYPESHHLISDETTIQAMFEKEPMATYIVSQICFDAEVIVTWVRRVHARGTLLPIWIGVAGTISNRRLLRIAGRVGLGDSARLLKAHGAWVRRLVRRWRLHADTADQGARATGRQRRSPDRGLPHLYLQRAGADREMATAARRPADR